MPSPDPSPKTELLADCAVPEYRPSEALPGGAATSLSPADRNAFSHSSANLPFAREFDFKIGNGVFRKQWVSAPSSTTASDGLGPLYNARACQNCHLKDGRGRPPAVGNADDRAVSMLLKLGVPPRNEEERAKLAGASLGSIPDPVYGAQFQEFAIQGHQPEGRLAITYQELPPITLPGGETVTLRKPRYEIREPRYGPPSPDLMTSPRVAPQMIGLGLLEAIREEDILAGPEMPAAKAEGIVGQPNRVWSPANGRVMLGRFGWKAGQATIADQAAAAFAGDMGLSTRLVTAHAGDCTAHQKDCLTAPNGATPRRGPNEVADSMFDLVVFYSRNLAVPQARNAGSPEFLAGRAIFYRSGCAACHRPSFVTGSGPDIQPELAGQTIWPYTDLLLHDMGPGLADGFRERAADGRQWRTAPLWGIGLTETVAGHSTFLHDGRARSVLEAILWHGGEAETAKQRVITLSPEERASLLAFVNAL
ncbi:di-heme oxidoredictase family protein [Rhodoligotrophos defluvii]|uniref:di-heme oxidoreductase family protein n=1 Tax=Rhodoligotrophos defluvii TaxID=2561934 RepID=UPI00195FE9AE|nr:di-heme oxidoredictase family protein [Rhodoligotrophos defluvii]